ncbi:sporulation protein YqfD [Allobacillus sp. GCM10007491]|uniref:Sporulation protein YqfD n=2 Tax=Allobacillus TaxID=1400133 RepID=A0A941CUR7_9BACI|nr:sporulation protein YqfD [Allobacillus saliphilus]TSJ67744.1 sporulation protein YqfD [Allobacillus salarius]
MNKYSRKIKGTVIVDVEGKQIESLINRMLEENVQISALRRTSAEEASFQISYKDVSFVKRFRKEYQCKIRFKEKSGFPRIYEQRKKWIPGMIGIVIGFAIIFCLSNLIWNVTIKGGTAESRFEVQALTKELGLVEGKWIQQTANISTIEREIMNKIEEISYVGIQRHGTSYYIVIEESEKEIREQTERPSHLVAEKSGTIHSMYVTDGRPLVKINDVVKKGDVLVSGLLDEEGDVTTTSKGEVLAEVWYHLQLTINLKQEQLNLIPDPVTTYQLRIGDRQIGKEENELRLVHEEKTPFYFFKWPLPISLTKQYYYDEQSSELEYDIEEQLPSLIEERLKRELGQQVKLQYQKVLHEHRDSDKVKLEMFVKVIEDISTQQNIDQGD